MNKVGNILFWFGVISSFVSLLILIGGSYLPFEFSDENFGKGFYGLMACTFPIAIAFTLVRPNSNKNYRIFAIVIAIISLPILALYILGSQMCGYITDETLFTSKIDTSEKIIERHYDCGAYDSELPKHEFFQIKPLTQKVYYCKKIDTLLVDKTKWFRK